MALFLLMVGNSYADRIETEIFNFTNKVYITLAPTSSSQAVSKAYVDTVTTGMITNGWDSTFNLNGELRINGLSPHISLLPNAEFFLTGGVDWSFRIDSNGWVNGQWMGGLSNYVLDASCTFPTYVVTNLTTTFNLSSGVSTTSIKQIATAFAGGYINDCLSISNNEPGGASIKLYSTNDLSLYGNIGLNPGGNGQVLMKWTNGNYLAFLNTGWMDMSEAWKGIKGGMISNTVIDASCTFPGKTWTAAFLDPRFTPNITNLITVTNGLICGWQTNSVEVVPPIPTP